MVCGAISGAISSIAMTPLDVVKTRLATGSYIASLGLRGGLLKLAREEGLAGLFAGAKARMVGAALFSAIGLSTYEACKKAFRCGDEATAAAAAAAASDWGAGNCCLWWSGQGCPHATARGWRPAGRLACTPCPTPSTPPSTRSASSSRCASLAR
mmetsp:Transcript_22488/g.53281  ORF Transcript_22488/g.53281 Transcript_22488/m.53281 type:complete len:155 (+) Transcript_22488:783-1247(+)